MVKSFGSSVALETFRHEVMDMQGDLIGKLALDEFQFGCKVGFFRNIEITE